MLGRNYERLQQMYSENEYYWGREPNEFAKQGMKFLPRQPGNRRLRAVDIGAGEGRDAVFSPSAAWIYWPWTLRRTAWKRRIGSLKRKA